MKSEHREEMLHAQKQRLTTGITNGSGNGGAIYAPNNYQDELKQQLPEKAFGRYIVIKMLV